MEFEDENEIRCSVAAGAKCDVLITLKRVWGYDIPVVCPWKRLEKAAFERDEAAEKTAKYKLEYPD